MTETKRVGGKGDRCAAHMDKRHAIMQKKGSHATWGQAEYMIYHSCTHTSYDDQMKNNTDIMLKDDRDNIQARGNNTASQTMCNSEFMHVK